MSERKWTSAQLSAIEYRGKNLLVSAAAGSGKTATLTERIIRLITDEDIRADISRMLVVTFTRAAAAELRDRVAAALGVAAAKDPENRHLTEQLCRIGGAMICTMDSFFLSCVRPMFAEVGLPSDFRIGDKAELEALKEEAMEDTVNHFFDSGDPQMERAITVIAEAVGNARTEEGIDDVLLTLDEETGRVGIGARELSAYADEFERYKDTDILRTPFGECILNELLSGFRHYGHAAAELADAMSSEDGLLRSYVPAARSMADYCERCISAAVSGDTDTLRHLMGEVPADRINTKTPTNDSEIFKALRGDFKKYVTKMHSDYLKDDSKASADVMMRTAEVCRFAGMVIGEFRERYGELKRQKGITDHSDVARMAASLLADENGVPTPYGESIASRYDYVFIDEYQDTSIYQDRIFAAVSSKCGRFMVGDIKQSIYRFRGGEPEVFRDYRDRWSDGDEGDTVFMSENFRCAEPVVKFVNAVSRYMFPFGGISFEEGDLLIHGRDESKNTSPSPVEVCLIERPGKQRGGKSDDEDDTDDPTIPPAAVLEAEYVAKRIRHMLDSETLPDGSAVNPSDIALMLRETKTRREIIAGAFKKYGIPLKSVEERPFFERPEIVLILCVLRAVDNPLRDIYLAGAMRSAVFGFDLGDIALITYNYRKNGGAGTLYDAVLNEAETEGVLGDRCRRFCDKINEYRKISCTVAADTFIYRLIHDPVVADALEGEGGVGAAKRALKLYELARGRGLGLYEFLGYAEHLEKTGLDEEESAGEGVSLITVHHSKGLEFPVCFLMNATRRYSTSDAKKSMLIDRDFGVALKLSDEGGLVRCDNHLRRLAIFRSMRESAYEEMRVLYVAMTRARERLIITGVTNSLEGLRGGAAGGARFYDEFSVVHKNNYMDMILEALHLYGGPFATVTDVPYITDDTSLTDEDGYFSDIHNNEERSPEDREICEMIGNRTDFEYKYRHLQNIPSKLTVSRLYPEILDEFDDGAAELGTDEEIVPAIPKFIKGTAYSPADAGSAAHLFLQFCDFEKLRDLGVGAELCRLTSEGFMSPADGEAADLDYIEAFRKSDFFRRILSAKEVRREFRFNAAIPASALTGDAEKTALFEDDGTLVIAQGVIDIVFTDKDGKLVLADYKTDRLTEYELAHRTAASKKLWDRHKNQLGYYARVCEKLFGRAPDEVVIYSMPLGDTV